MNLKNLWFALSVMLVTNTCYAFGNMHEVSIDDLMFVFYVCCGISALAIILCVISYFFRSRVLNIIAWVAAILSIITAQVITHTAYSILSAIIPALCLAILWARVVKRKTGTAFLVAYILKSIAWLVVAFNVCKMILEIYASNFLAIHTYAYQIFLVLLFSAVIFFQLHKLLKRLNDKNISTPRIFRPVLWSILIGIGAYIIDIAYMLILSHSRRYHIDMSDLLFHVPYLNILINFLCWIVTGTLAYMFYNLQKEKIK